MKRIFFNGVSKFSYDGSFISFSLDDTKSDPQIGIDNEIVFTGICDLKALKGIVDFLNTQIQEVEKRDAGVSENNASENEIESTDETETLVILKATDFESHN